MAVDGQEDDAHLRQRAAKRVLGEAAELKEAASAKTKKGSHKG